jgi:tetrahydromethanopterin S-methyltransferase subunit C
MKASFNPVITTIVAAAVGAVLGILAVSLGTSAADNTRPVKVDQPLIVYGER